VEFHRRSFPPSWSKLGAEAPLATGSSSALGLGHEDLMEPVRYPRAFTAPGCTFEMKVDGFRAFARSRGGQVSPISRAGRGTDGPFPEAISALASIPGD
jgi:hypothetical protein